MRGRVAITAALALFVTGCTIGGRSAEEIANDPTSELPADDAGPVGDPDPPPLGENAVVATVTHSASAVVAAANSVSCNDVQLIHDDNRYFRVFSLSAAGIASDFAVTEVSFGVESASSPAGVQAAIVRLHTLAGEVSLANLTQLAEVAVDVPNQELGTIVVPIQATAPAGSTLVVEVNTPNGNPGGNSLFIGSNTAGQSGPGYISAPGCNIQGMQDLAILGFPEVHLVMSATGFHVPAN